jgi:iron complex outermembrane receptor protein
MTSLKLELCAHAPSAEGLRAPPVRAFLGPTGLTRAAWVGVLACAAPISTTMAQHAADNPILSAEDAFGLTVGLESTGLYNPVLIRGFNPQTAGNARIDGLYFDQQGQLSNRVVESSTIRVGISEIGYAFPAPTGIVDYDLRHATGGNATATVIAEAGPYDEKSISVDGSLPLDGKLLQLPIGVNCATGAPPPGGANLGYTSNLANIGAAPVWQPNDAITVRTFADWQENTRARTLPTVFTAGDFLPPRIERGFLGQYWALGKYGAENLGGIIDAKLASHWSIAAGIFRSVSNIPVSYADLLVNTQPNGLAEHVMVGLPDQHAASYSGEARLTGAFTQGSLVQKVVFLVRGRDEQAGYGGADSLEVGTTYIGDPARAAQPDFVFSARTSDHLLLRSTGTAYQVQRAGLGEFDVGAQKEFYDKTVLTPGTPQSRLTDDPGRLYGSAAVPIRGAIIAYADYTQGFEDSGAVPTTAANRGAILPTTRTWQVNGGLRFALSSNLSLIAGYFELNRPYFNFDVHNVDRQLGVQRASGLELSLAGEVANGLNVNAGALIGQVHVMGPDLAAQGVGTAALGQPHNTVLANAVYALPQLAALSVDLGFAHYSRAPAVVDNAYYIPQLNVLNFGARYQFTLRGAPATLRMQMQNALNTYIWNVNYSPGFIQFAPRTYLVYLTVDV